MTKTRLEYFIFQLQRERAVDDIIVSGNHGQVDADAFVFIAGRKYLRYPVGIIRFQVAINNTNQSAQADWADSKWLPTPAGII